MHRLVLGLAALVAAVVVSPAFASQIVSTSSVSNLTLGVNAKGEAMVSYTSGGKVVHVLAYGAVNAIAPTRTGTQVAFTFDYDGGYQKEYTDNPTVIATLKSLRALQVESRKLLAANNKQESYVLGPKIADDYATLDKLRAAAENYWQTFSCPSYDGPALADMLAACEAPDGSYWAVQSWDRDLPDYGATPTTAQSQIEVHLSHWTGAIAQLTVHTDWAWGGQWNHLWGTYTYDGQGVYGFSSTSGGVPLDTFGRNVYVDTYDAAYGSGWVRENSFLTHDPAGSFCYSFNPHGSHPAGNGSQYRLTILGPGVTPDVSVTVPAPGPYSAAGQAADNAALAALGDPLCEVHG